MADLQGPIVRSITPAGLIHIPRRFPRLAWTDEAGNHEAVLKKRVVVGASSAADLVIDDVAVSRIHAELEPRDEGLWIRDLSSSNGTFVGNARVREIVLRRSRTITIGTTVIAVDYENSVTAPVELWPTNHFHDLVGSSAVMRELFALLARIAPTNASVSIQGETGTGKEVVARAIHDASARANGPFVIVDCGALASNLLDAELFGHTKGAFTGAVHARAGAIELADGGTVFLDEIGEVPLSMQPKLLRVLEQRTVRRIGDSAHRPVDVRFITATHRDLLSMVSRGEFREDLFFRMSVLLVRVPSLRERPGDIPVLVEHFLQGNTLSPDFVANLVRGAHSLRGNVRELRNLVERARVLGEDRMESLRLGASDEVPASNPLPRTRPTQPPSGFSPDESPTRESLLLERLSLRPPVQQSVPAIAPHSEMPVPCEGELKTFRERWNDHGEREYLRQLLERHARNIPAIAREAGVNRTYIYRLMRKHRL